MLCEFYLNLNSAVKKIKQEEVPIPLQKSQKTKEHGYFMGYRNQRRASCKSGCKQRH